MNNFQELSNGQVLIERDPNIWTHYDMQFHLQLTASKTNILSDGVDFATVTAKVFNYLNEHQATDQATMIVFEVDGQELPAVQVVNGQASIEVDSDIPDEIIIRTVNANVRNGEVVLNAG